MFKFLHIGSNENFIVSIIKFIEENFEFEQHQFHLKSGMGAALRRTNVRVYDHVLLEKLKYYFLVIIKMHKAEKIILHGLFDIKLVLILFLFPWLLKKCYWVIWGGDLYIYKLSKKNWKWKCNEFFRKPVIKNIGHLVTYIKGDIQLAREWYDAKGEYVECLMYLSNVYQDYHFEKSKSDVTTILLGNSADPSNEHLEVLQKLAQFKDQNIKVITPLSYGNKEYAQQIILEGKKQLGGKFQPLTDFMPFDEYLKILAEVDVAIFNHKRQQAMGNTITLLGLGKKVYMRSDVAQWQLFQELGVEVNDVATLENTLFEEIDRPNLSNKAIVKNYFSKESLIKQLSTYLD